MTGDAFAALREERKAGRARGLYSVCSAHPLVLEAAVRRASACPHPILVEATANQVNQYGGYTGMAPAEFSARLAFLSSVHEVPEGRIVFGGDHLGPYPWRSQPAEEAMAEADVLVRAFVAAGARKLHLDTSMALGGDHAPLEPEKAAARAIDLCRAAEDEFARCREARACAFEPVYVIGTEVPVPGGAELRIEEFRDDDGGPAPTSPEDFMAAVELYGDLFYRAGLEDAWNRVVAMVVQPGIEFDAMRVYPYRSERAEGLVAALASKCPLLFEGHSTDYQSDSALSALVRDGVAYLKVGPALTFVLREALFGLDAAAREMGLAREASLKDVVIDAMRERPEHWKGYYTEGDSLEFSLKYAFSDRIRYYWDCPSVSVAQRRLFDSLRSVRVPTQILSQMLPRCAGVHQASSSSRSPEELVL
ncbi:MAG: class II D-tagatose-bisphosphate aldolase, non-catalytic subunit, partial [Spirochaetaceae bacterium]|nr:class II D-tagatose-bisphosphate aldolase, non-catalytic subunit [Spirochaetaceae bacterium]